MPEAGTPLSDAAPSAAFAVMDWLIVVAYLVIVISIGIAVTRFRGRDDYFLAGRSMPMWAVAISVLATAQSAATFVGGPQEAYAGNLTYLSANLGALIAVVVVAIFFIPAYYRHGVTSVYELIGHHYGSASQRMASGMFMLGRVFASGARLFIVALPFSLIAFGTIEPRSLLAAIVIITVGATIYTSFGGIRAVIWTDVLQTVLYIGAIVFALIWIWNLIPLSPAEIVDLLRRDDSGSKLTLIDASFDKEFLTRPYHIAAILLGLTLFNMAAFGADQDLTQRMLTCRSARAGSWSVIISNIIGWPVILLFLLMGLLLFVYYNHPESLGAAAPAYQVEDTRRVFLEFIVREIPTPIRGVMMAGLFAAAMSTLDSGLNAMASTTIADFIRPALRRRCGEGERTARLERIWSRVAMIWWAAVLGSFAAGCIVWQERSGQTLIAFALGVMVYAYAGMLAVFLAAIFTPYGSPMSVALALAAGFVSVFILEFPSHAATLATLAPSAVAGLWRPPASFDLQIPLAFPWRMLICTGIAFVICCLGGRRRTGSVAPPCVTGPGCAQAV